MCSWQRVNDKFIFFIFKFAKFTVSLNSGQNMDIVYASMNVKKYLGFIL